MPSWIGRGKLGTRALTFRRRRAIVRHMSKNHGSKRLDAGEAWKVLRNFQSGGDSFREGETLALLQTDSETGEHTFRGEDGALKKWGLKRGLTDYSALVFARGAEASL
jgi:hypothetical protein